MSTATVVDLDALPAVLNVEQVRRILGISRPTAYQLTHQAGFPVVRIGRSVRIPKQALVEWLAKKTSGVSAQQELVMV